MVPRKKEAEPHFYSNISLDIFTRDTTLITQFLTVTAGMNMAEFLPARGSRTHIYTLNIYQAERLELNYFNMNSAYY